MDIPALATGGTMIGIGAGATTYGSIKALPALRELAALDSLDVGVAFSVDFERSTPAIQRSLDNLELVTAKLGENPGIGDIVRAFRAFDGTSHSDMAKAMSELAEHSTPFRRALQADNASYRIVKSTLPIHGSIAVGGALVATAGAGLLLSTLFRGDA